jgi:cytochrome c553
MKVPLIVIVFSLLLVMFGYSQTSYKGFTRVHACNDSCYEATVKQFGTAAEVLRAKRLTSLNKSTIDQGKDLYSKNCQACHGESGQGGIGPYLVGKEDIVSSLQAYKRKETRGPQSAIMWPNAQQLSTADMEHLAEYIDSFSN